MALAAIGRGVVVLSVVAPGVGGGRGPPAWSSSASWRVTAAAAATLRLQPRPQPPKAAGRRRHLRRRRRGGAAGPGRPPYLPWCHGLARAAPHCRRPPPPVPYQYTNFPPPITAPCTRPPAHAPKATTTNHSHTLTPPLSTPSPDHSLHDHQALLPHIVQQKHPPPPLVHYPRMPPGQLIRGPQPHSMTDSVLAAAAPPRGWRVGGPDGQRRPAVRHHQVPDGIVGAAADEGTGSAGRVRVEPLPAAGGALPATGAEVVAAPGAAFRGGRRQASRRGSEGRRGAAPAFRGKRRGGEVGKAGLGHDVEGGVWGRWAPSRSTTGALVKGDGRRPEAATAVAAEGRRNTVNAARFFSRGGG